MQNFVQPGRTLTVSASADVSGGDLVVVGSIVGVAACDAASGDDVAVDVEGVFTLPKITTDIVTQGAKLYWDSTTSKLTVTPGTDSKPLVGYAARASASGETTVDAKIIQSLQTGPSA